MPICPHCDMEFTYHTDYDSENERVLNVKYIKRYQEMIFWQKIYPIGALLFIALLFIKLPFPPWQTHFWDGVYKGYISGGLAWWAFTYIQQRKLLKEILPVLRSQGFKI